MAASTIAGGRWPLSARRPAAGPLRRRVPAAELRHAASRRDDRAGRCRPADATLRLSMSADVAVTGKRTFRNIADLDRPDGGLIGVADSASEGLITGQQIDARPIMRAGEILETVPGLIISQHSGEGKANQYYLRGFNLDHGTDFTTTVAGVPVNMPTHAHGHGYSDLNFLIPELVSGVQFRKGPYFAEEGDFSAAGASHIRYTNALDRPAVPRQRRRGWLGPRAGGGVSARLGTGRLLVAAEAQPQRRPVGARRRLRAAERGGPLQRWRYAQRVVADGDGLRRIVAGHRSGAAPRHRRGALSRFDGVDDTTGGDTSRVSLSGDWQRTTPEGLTRANAYVMRYALDLFSNFTYFLDDPVNGDQFQQSDRRIVSGGRVSHRLAPRLGGRPTELVVGADLRHDAIGRLALLHTAAATAALGHARRPRVADLGGGYLQHEVQWTPWMRSSAGLRARSLQFDVEAGHPENSGTAGDGPSPARRPRSIFGPWRATELYVNAGYGLPLERRARHDAHRRSRSAGAPPVASRPWPARSGAEVGARMVPLTGPRDGRRCLAARPRRGAAVRRRRRQRPKPPRPAADGAWSGTPTPRRGLADRRRGPRVVARALHGRGSGGRSHSRRRRASGVSGRDASTAAALAFGSLRLRYFGGRNLVEDGSVRSSRPAC